VRPLVGTPIGKPILMMVGCVINEALIGTPKLKMVGCIVINVACCI
jgi:hypothetical protein